MTKLLRPAKGKNVPSVLARSAIMAKFDMRLRGDTANKKLREKTLAQELFSDLADARHLIDRAFGYAEKILMAYAESEEKKASRKRNRKSDG